MDKSQNQLSTGQRIGKPSDDPGAATNQMYFRTRVSELGQFSNNINYANDRLNHIDGNLESVTSIMHRIRDLTVQAANGIYQGDNGFELKKVIASEIDQQLRQLVELANGKDSTGRPLFGGFTTENSPFEVIQSTVAGMEGLELDKQITSVQYKGDIGQRLAETDRGHYIDVNLAGNRAFWGTNMTVTGAQDTSVYRATTDQAFRINGTEVRVAAGDTANDVIDKINSAGLELRASKIGPDYLSLHTTSPHQIWLEDIEGGTVLRDLGLVSGMDSKPPNNYAETATVSGMNLFDVVIKLRNDLYSADQLEIGGRDLGMIDETMENLLRHRSDVGARTNRLDEQSKKIAWDQTYMTELLGKSEGIDFAETIMNLKWQETVHQYALNVGSRVIKQSLLDFLR
jgi:flagellar hook-associated protein 3 FlgL